MPTKQSLKSRLEDEKRGIFAGQQADLHPKGMQKADEVPIPDIKDLCPDQPALVRKLTPLVLEEAELGETQRTAEKSRKKVKDSIKALIGELGIASDETPAFWCAGMRVSHWEQLRESLDKDALRIALQELGVKPSVIAQAFAKATKVSPTYTLRVTVPGEEE